MATVTQPFLARNRRFDVGDEVDDGDPLVNDYPHLFGRDPEPLAVFGPVFDDDDVKGDG